MKITPIFAITAAALLSACASTQTCNAPANYRKAGAIAPIKAAEGLTIPQSPSALKVPELTPAALAAARDQPMPRRGKGTACLDYPPDISAGEAASPAPKS